MGKKRVTRYSKLPKLTPLPAAPTLAPKKRNNYFKKIFAQLFAQLNNFLLLLYEKISRNYGGE